MKYCTDQSRNTKRHPMAALLMVVVAGSAAMTFSLAAVSPSPDAPAPRQGATLNQDAQADLDALHNQLNSIMRLEQSTLQQINVGPNHPLDGQLMIELDGMPVTVTYWPHSVRSDIFTVWEHVDDGSMVEIEPAPERTIRGVIDEMPGSFAFGSLLDDGLYAGFNLPDGRLLWIEPVAAHIQGAEETLHVLYDAKDADCEQGMCGMVQQQQQGFGRFNIGGVGPADEVDLLDDGEPAMAFNNDCEVADIAFDADFSYYQLLGSSSANVTNAINNIINAINANQYEPQVGIKHEITQIVIRTSSGQNPYTSCSAQTLLNQFRNVWRTSPESSIPRDMAHLMTGCNMGGILGIAWLGTVCDSIHGNHYALSRRMTQFSCQTDLVAHETGHNWNAQHCSCSSSTMNASITCANTFTGAGSNSVNQILSFKNSVSCLGPCIPPEPPLNNTCANRIVVGEGSTAYTNEHATTDGPSESDKCSFFGDPQIQHDVWFQHTATCTGELTVAACDGTFNTKVGLYLGSSCPTQSNTVDECDTTSCPNNRATATIAVEEGDTVIIRVGSRSTGATGDGTINVTCEEVAPPACPADLNDDGVVDGADLLILLGSWGNCPGCDADLNGDDVVDGADLLILLGAWGGCP